MLSDFLRINEVGFLQQEFFGNSVLDYIFFLLFLFFLFLIIKLLEKILLSKLKESKTGQGLKGVLIKFVLSIRSQFYLFVAFYLSLLTLNISEQIINFLTGILFFWIVFRVMIGVQMLVDYLLNKKILSDAGPEAEVVGKNLATVVKVVLWIFAILLALSNFGVEVTSLIAGLGIGGIAIAFAFQNILEDLFSSFTIYFDKPFTVGEFIEIEGERGIVEKIGIKSTRIRSPRGEEVIISNKELTNEKIHNLKKLERRRVIFQFGVLYGTTNEKMEKIPKIMKEIIDSQDLTEFDRTHFNNFGDSALEFEAAYFVNSADFADYRNAHQEVLLGVKIEFEKEGIEMAFPTRTVHLSKE